jgi:hypothetical protein
MQGPPEEKYVRVTAAQNVMADARSPLHNLVIGNRLNSSALDPVNPSPCLSNPHRHAKPCHNGQVIMHTTITESEAAGLHTVSCMIT